MLILDPISDVNNDLRQHLMLLPSMFQEMDKIVAKIQKHVHNNQLTLNCWIYKNPTMVSLRIPLFSNNTRRLARPTAVSVADKS